MKKNIIKCVAFGVLFLASFYFFHSILLFKSTEIMSKDYRKYGKNQFDIIFAGSSTMKNAVYPMELWNEYGFCSYNLACGSQSIPSSYYIIKEAIREQHPKIVVLDCYFSVLETAYLSNEHLHYVTDQMHGKEKLELIRDLVPSEDRLEFLLPLVRYHSRWKELNLQDLIYSEHAQYGAKVHYYLRAPVIEQEYHISTEKKEIPDISLMYLKKIIQLCQKNQVQLLLTEMPVDWNAEDNQFGKRSGRQPYYNKIQDIADEYQIPYLNYDVLEQEVGLDMEHDYGDTTHLNAYGAKKMTAYLGAYIKEHYDIPDRRGDRAYEFLNEDYQIFSKYKNALHLASVTDLREYLALLRQMDNQTVIFAVKDIQGYYLTPAIISEMKAMGFQNAEILLEKRYHSFIGIVSDGVRIAEQIGTDDEPSEYSGMVGDLSVEAVSQTLNGGNQARIMVDGKDYSLNLRGFNMIVIDNDSKEVIDQVNFDTHADGMGCRR